MRSVLVLLFLRGLSAASPLAVHQLIVQQFEDGPPVLPPETFQAGELVNFSFRVENFIRKENRVSLSFEAQPADESAVSLVPSVTGKLDTALTPEDKEWVPKLRGSFVLPPVLLPGEYKLSVRLRDELANSEARSLISFSVAGPRIDPSPVLVIRNYSFYANDEDAKPLDAAAYRIGEEIHARFVLIGFRHDENSAIDVTYGVALSDAEGHVLYQEPSAARDDTKGFYPKPYVPASFSLSLKPGTPAGEFTLTVSASDVVGHQQASAKRTFRAE